MKGRVGRGWWALGGVLVVGLMVFGLNLQGAPAEDGAFVDVGIADQVGDVDEATSVSRQSAARLLAPQKTGGLRFARLKSAEPVAAFGGIGGIADVGDPCDCDADCAVEGLQDQCLKAECVDGACEHNWLDVGDRCDVDGNYCTSDACAHSGVSLCVGGTNAGGVCTGAADCPGGYCGDEVVCMARADGAGGNLSPCAKECVGGTENGLWCYEAGDCPGGACMPKTGVTCDESEDWCELSSGLGRCCDSSGGCTHTTEVNCTGGTWLRVSDPDDLGHCWCPAYSSGIAPRGDILTVVETIIPSWKVCEHNENLCEGDGTADCHGYCNVSEELCDTNDDCPAGETCLADACIDDVEACDDGFLYLGDDYSLAAGTGPIRLNEFRFRGGIQNRGEAIVVSFYTMEGLFVDSFGMLIPESGAHYWTYEVDCYPDCDNNTDNADFPEDPPVIIPESGYVVFSSWRHEANWTNAHWASTDTVDFGTNDPDLLWYETKVDGKHTDDYPGTTPDVMIFELVGQPLGTNDEPNGACCTVDTGVGVCDDTPRWECGFCEKDPAVACSTSRDCSADDFCSFRNWFGPVAHEDYTGHTGILCDGNAPCDTGACCADDGTCTPDSNPGACDSAGGTFLGFATSCDPNCCPPPDTETGADAACDIYQCHDGTDWVDPYDMCGSSDPDDPDCDTAAGETCMLRASGPTAYTINIPALGSPSNAITFMGDSSGHEPYFGLVDGDDCNLGELHDVGWYEAIEIVNPDPMNPLIFDCAVVTVDYCCNDPMLDLVYIVLKDCCPCPGGGCWVTLDLDQAGVTRGGFGPGCGAEHCCQDGNFAGTFTVPPGRYAVQIDASNVCEFTSNSCVDDDDCRPGQPCIDKRGPYTGHVTVGPCSPAACCVNRCVGGANDGAVCEGDTDCPDGACNNVCEVVPGIICEENGGDWLGYGDPVTPTCAASPCSQGSCCTGGGVCEDGAAYDTEAECEAAGGVYHGHLVCDDGPCATCSFESSTNCKEDDDDGSIYVSDRSPGVEIRIADDFRPAGTQIGEICWTGAFYGSNEDGTQFECADNPPPDSWQVRFFEDSNGVPGTELAPVGGQIVTIIASSADGGTSRLWRYMGGLPQAVFVTPGDCYWIEITGLGEGEYGCHTYWATALEGNDHSMRDMADPGVYGPEDANNVDFHFCVDTGLQGTEDCGDVRAACCTCPGICVDDQTAAQCTAQDGVWRLGMTCLDTPACPGPPVNDDCADAIEVEHAAIDSPPFIVDFENVCAERHGGPATECANYDGDLKHDVWYVYTAPGTGELKVSACDLLVWDTMMAAYPGGVDACVPTIDDELTCGDEDCDDFGPSEITLRVLAGQEYLIRIGGWRTPMYQINPRGWGQLEFTYTDNPPSVEPPIAAPSPEGGPKNRYISIRSANVGTPVALQVIVASSQYFPDSVGETKYVGAQTASGYYPLIDIPLVQVWPEEDLHIFDCMIHPVATFEVRAGDGAGTWSDPLTIGTITKPGGKNHGDIVGSFTGTWQPPEGNMSMNDLMAALQAFGNAATAPPKHWADVHDDGPNQLVNMSDVLLLVNAFGGSAYPYNPGTAAVPCS